MPALTITRFCVLVLLTVQAITINGQGGGHTHTDYASEQDIIELEEKFEALKTEWEMKQHYLQNVRNFWQYSLLSLVEMLHNTSLGVSFLQYLRQQEEAFQKVEDTINDLRDYIDIGTPHNPASSCKDLLPYNTSGLYWLKNPMGNVSQQYCDMEKEGCGTRGGWMRVAHVNMTQPDQVCPPGFMINTYSGGAGGTKTLCGRPGPAGCVSTTFSTNDIPYNLVCGKVIAYQDRTPNGPCPYTKDQTTIDDSYIDGVSLTHGSPRQHVWSFMASRGEDAGPCSACPCFNTSDSVYAPFIGNDYFCDTGAESRDFIFYGDDPLWDGQGCGPNNGCCIFNNPPWFCKQLPQIISDDLELRICGNEPTDDEDVPIEHIELYVQ